MSNEDEQAQYEELMAERPGFLGDEEIRYRKLAQLGERVLEILNSEFWSDAQYEDRAAELLPRIQGAARSLGLLDQEGKP